MSPPLFLSSPTVPVSFSCSSPKSGVTPVTAPHPPLSHSEFPRGHKQTSQLEPLCFESQFLSGVKYVPPNNSPQGNKHTHIHAHTRNVEPRDWILSRRHRNTELKIQQITCVFVNTDPTWSMTYCYMKYTGDCTSIAWYTGMEKSIFAQHQTKSEFFWTLFYPGLISMFSQQWNYQISGCYRGKNV